MTRQHKIAYSNRREWCQSSDVTYEVTIVLYKVEKLRYLAFKDVKSLEDNPSLINFKTGTMCLYFLLNVLIILHS